MKQVDENRDWLMRRASQGAPHECCGFIMKDGAVVEIPNSSPNSHIAFRMTQQHLVDRVPNPQDIFAIWHTHPNGNTEPSPRDLEAIATGQIYPGWKYVIVTPRDIYAFDAKQFAPQEDSAFWEAFAR